MFSATVDRRPIPESEKMSHLKTLLTGKARSAFSEKGNSGQFYGAAWSILERNFGRHHVIIDAKLESLLKASQVKPHDSTGLINFSVIVLNLMNVLKEFKQIGDLRLSPKLYLAVDKVPQFLKEKWWFFFDDKDEDWLDLIMFEKWLFRIAFVLYNYSKLKQSFKGEQNQKDRRSTNREKRFSKTLNFSASSNVKETKQTQSDHCPLTDGTHEIWICPLFKKMSANDRYAAVRNQRLCYRCLGKGHAIKNCKVNACGINECIKKHNRLKTPENQMDEGNNAVNVSAATINQSNEFTSFLQIDPVSVQSCGNRLNTYAFLDSGSTVSIIAQSVQEKLRAQVTDVTLNIAGIHGTKDLKTEKVHLKIKGLHSKVHSIEAFAHPSICMGNTNYNYSKLKQSFKGEQNQKDRRSTNREKRFSKTLNFSASSNVKETKQTQSDHCPLTDGTHEIWICPLFKKMSANDRYAAVRNQRLCYRCLGKGHAIKNCKVNACGINECIKKHNRLKTPENQMDEGNNAVNVSAATINQSNEFTSFLQIDPVSVQSCGNRLNTYAFLDSGSTVSIIAQSVQEKLRAQVTDVTFNIAGIHGTKDLKTEKVHLKIKGLHSKVHSIEAFAHPSICMGNTNYNYSKLKQSFNHLSFLPKKSFNLMEIGSIFGQDAYEQHAHWTTR